MGPSTERGGWIRTGYYDSGSSIAGYGNCNVWSRNDVYGTYALLNDNFNNLEENIGPFRTVGGSCNLNNVHVWCVEDYISDQFYQLNVSKSGTGNGTVTSSPAGIDCGSDCNEQYIYDTSVTLTAVAESGSTFNGWSGDCSDGGVCEITIDAAKSVTATFNLGIANYLPLVKR
jgi:hypothetical protein